MYRLLTRLTVCCVALCQVVCSSQVSNGTTDCSLCESNALCVDLDQAWISRKLDSLLEIDLPTAHRIAKKHASRCKTPDLSSVIIRGDLARYLAASPHSYLKITTGPRHQLRPGDDATDDAAAEDAAARRQHLHWARPVRCSNTAGRLPSPSAAATFCGADTPAVVVQDVDYSGSDVSMTCAFCPATHAFASVSTRGASPVLDVVLPAGPAAPEVSVHLVLALVDVPANEPTKCYLKCDQSRQCVTYDQVCDEHPDCDDRAMNSSMDENSALCPLVRYERARRVKLTALLAAGASVAAVCVLGAAMALGVAVRHWWLRRSKPLATADNQSLSLTDKASLL